MIFTSVTRMKVYASSETTNKSVRQTSGRVRAGSGVVIPQVSLGMSGSKRPEDVSVTLQLLAVLTVQAASASTQTVAVVRPV